MTNMTNEEHNKWEMNQAGVLNYWYYKYQLFPFEKGHLLLKGQNGSGKSLTTQSFLPLLLDGNKQPQRLDPFGSRSRKFIDYIFGENPEETEKTGYLFLEYKKQKTEERIVTGIGYRANINKNEVNTWYFVLKNVQIGENFSLYKSELDDSGDKVMRPLTQKELTGAVEREKCGYVVSKSTEYMELVNRYIFKFETIQEFQEMVDLVVRIRTPKLSNDLGPKVIYDILQKSLPELSLNDLRSLSETIQNMDQIKQRLDKTKADLSLISSLSKKYQTYNMAVLSNKAKLLTDVDKKRKKTNAEFKAAEKSLIQANQDLQNKQIELDELEIEFKTLETQLEQWKDHDVFKIRQALIALEKQLKEKEKELQDTKNILETKEKRLRDVNSDIDEKEDEEYQMQQSIKLHMEELDAISYDIEYIGHELNKSNFEVKLLTDNPLEVMGQWRVNAEEHQDKMEKIYRLLSKEKDLDADMSEQRKNLSDLEENKKEMKANEAMYNQELEEEIETLNRNIMQWNDENEELVLAKNELKVIMDSVFQIGESANAKQDVTASIGEFFHHRRTALINKKAEYQASKKQIQKEISEKELEIEALKQQEEPTFPFRKKETDEARKELVGLNIPFAPFYEVVDFKENVSDAIKERIESALLEMGILDSLFVSEQYIHLVNQSDTILVASECKESEHTMDAYLDVCLPDELSDMHEMVQNVLRSISTEVSAEHTYVTTNGRYFHGVVEGVAVQSESSVYIGKESRKRHKEKMLETLSQEFQALKQVENDIVMQVQRVALQEEQLKTEKEQFPSFKSVTEVEQKIYETEQELVLLEKDLKRISDGLSNKQEAFQTVRNERMELTQERTTPLTTDAYERVVQDTKEYLNEMISLKESVMRLSQLKKELERLHISKEEYETDVDEFQGLLYGKELEIKKITSNIQAKEAASKECNIDELEKNIDACERRKQEIPPLQQTLSETIGGLKTSIPALTAEVASKTDAIEFYKKYFELCRELFVSEMNRKFIEEYDHETLLDEEDILLLASTVSEDDVDMLCDKVMDKYKALLEEFNTVRVKGLEEYSITNSEVQTNVEQISDEGNEWFAKELEVVEEMKKRIVITLSYEGKMMSPMTLIQEIEEQVKAIELSLTTQDEKLYREIIMDNIGEKIRELISQAKSWSKQVNHLMEERDTSSGLQLSLTWKAIDSTKEEEMTTSELVKLLQKDPETLKDSDFKKLSKHFSSKIDFAKELYETDENNKEKTLEMVIKEVLDYRKWFEFQLSYKLGGELRKELTKTRFNALSGGERAMSMYIPLLAALFSKYNSASPEAPYIVSMDEAFAGVDEENIRDMFELIDNLELNYILNSQSLWGDYDTVKSLSIAEIIRPKNAKHVSVLLHKWNGTKRVIVQQEGMKKREVLDEITLPDKQQSLFDELLG